MEAKTWIKWPDFGDDGEENGHWCIGTEDGSRIIAATVEATEQEADLLAIAPGLLEDALLASGYGIEALIPEDMRYSVPAWVFKARDAIAKAKGGTR